MSVMAPTAPMLNRPLEIQRAMRPLKRRTSARRASILDEEATATRIADQPPKNRVWAPVMSPAPERWLSLVLIVDDSPSMRLWRPLADELHETLIRLGAFRDLRMFSLAHAEAGDRIGISHSHGAPSVDPATVIDPSGRQIFLVLSDCSGRHWWEGHVDRALLAWSRSGPTAIVQPLAERLWRRTAVPTTAGTVSATRPCAPNTSLRFTSYDGDQAIGLGAVPVPVLQCSPGWLADWANLVSGDGVRRPAAMTYANDRPRHGGESVWRERELPIRERVLRFQTTASPEAARLASHVAVSFPVLPIMRLIQQRILHTSHPGHLAEVLLSGLLRPRDADRGLFDFVPGAREALLATLPRSASWHTADVLTQLSEEIERRAGAMAETFRAYLTSDSGAGGHSTGSGSRPFALVSTEAIRLLDSAVLPAPVATTSTMGEMQTDSTSPAGFSTGEVSQEMDAVGVHLPDPQGAGALFLTFDRRRQMAVPEAEVRELREVITDPALGALPPDRCPVRLNLEAQKVHARIRAAVEAAADTLLVYVTGRLHNSSRRGVVLADSSPGAEQAVRLADVRRQVRQSKARNRILIVDGVHDPSFGVLPPVRAWASLGLEEPAANVYEIIRVREPGGASLAAAIARIIRQGVANGGPGLAMMEIVKALESAGVESHAYVAEHAGPFHLTRNAAYSSPDIAVGPPGNPGIMPGPEPPRG